MVGLQIAFVSRVRNFSGRIVARSFHNACRAPRIALSLYGASASPDVLIRREREESAARDGRGERRRGRDGGEDGRSEKERKTEKTGIQWEREAFSL